MNITDNVTAPATLVAEAVTDSEIIVDVEEIIKE